MSEALELWILRQYRFAAQEMLRCISPVETVKARPAFGQTLTPKRGAVVASIELADYDPDPDYFYHWWRDAAVVIDAVRLLWLDGAMGERALGIFADFVRFNGALRALDGRERVRNSDWRKAVAASHVQYLRPDEELAAIHGANVSAEARVNADGSIDLQRWARPQHDGPAARAIALLNWREAAHGAIAPELNAELSTLVAEDLAFILERWRLPSFDIWEEESGFHYYTRRLQAAALARGGAWFLGLGEPARAAQCAAASREIRRALESHWADDLGFMQSRVAPEGAHPKALDMSVILAALHAADDEPDHSPLDSRLGTTLARLSEAFVDEFPINRERSLPAPAFGRYPGDVYYGGGAWYISTLAAAEFHYRAGAGGPRDQAMAAAQRGDAFLETTRRFVPRTGHMSEQFDRDSGEQRSAKRLAWSYAAFISCVTARKACLGRA